MRAYKKSTTRQTSDALAIIFLHLWYESNSRGYELKGGGEREVRRLDDLLHPLRRGPTIKSIKQMDLECAAISHATKYATSSYCVNQMQPIVILQFKC